MLLDKGRRAGIGGRMIPESRYLPCNACLEDEYQCIADS